MKKEYFDLFNSERTCRYILGCTGLKTLFVVGINPSTATKNKFDHTISVVDGMIKADNIYDSFIMINVYPQISTDNNELPVERNEDYHRANLNIIKKYFEKYKPLNIWTAWGDLINNKDYFKDCLKDIYALSIKYKANWYHRGPLTGSGHPKHPIGLRYDSIFNNFDMNEYLDKIFK